MKYMKGQLGGGPMIGDAVAIVVIMGIALLAVHSIVLALASIFLLRVYKKGYFSSKNFEERVIAFGLTIFVLLSLGIISLQFIPQLIDIPGSITPKLCKIHGFFLINVEGYREYACIVKASELQRDQDICGLLKKGEEKICVINAVKMGFGNCTGQGQECYGALAIKTNDPHQLCRLEGPVKFYKFNILGCIMYVLSEAPNASCDNISDTTYEDDYYNTSSNYRSFCQAAKKVIADGYCKTNNIPLGEGKDQKSCIVINTKKLEFCSFLDKDTPACIAYVLSEAPNASCEDISNSSYQAPTTKEFNMSVDYRSYCQAAKKAIADGYCKLEESDLHKSIDTINCIVNYTKKPEFCVLIHKTYPIKTFTKCFQLGKNNSFTTNDNGSVNGKPTNE
ncbi:MAG: hypothetical protein PHU12_03700 [Candidatus Aenigmarchaeota archaeon]|nr:hypothetical protein [Candidatus Aenigmarchaeota archaeon]